MHKPEDDGPTPMCQYCLADPRNSYLAIPPQEPCPVCGTAYTGPRRSRAFQVLLNAGYVAKGTD